MWEKDKKKKIAWGYVQFGNNSYWLDQNSDEFSELVSAASSLGHVNSAGTYDLNTLIPTSPTVRLKKTHYNINSCYGVKGLDTKYISVYKKCLSQLDKWPYCWHTHRYCATLLDEQLCDCESSTIVKFCRGGGGGDNSPRCFEVKYMYCKVIVSLHDTVKLRIFVWCLFSYFRCENWFTRTYSSYLQPSQKESPKRRENWKHRPHRPCTSV